MKNTDNTVGENTRIALAYIHIFADGSKYFGNGVNPNRPWDFKKRTKKWLEAYDKFGAPVVQVRRNLTIEEADALEKRLFDRYLLQGGIKLQSKPSGKDLANVAQPHTEIGKANISKAHVGFLGKSHTNETKVKMAASNSATQKGKTNSAHRNVISMKDGKITTANGAGHWNKKNPNYIGTWVDL